MSGRNSRAATLLAWILPIALAAAILVQLFHEAIHAAVALVLGASVQRFGFYAVETGWPPGVTDTGLQECLIAGSAAIANIAAASFCLAGFHRCVRPVGWRLLLYYFAAFSWFMGFGYLLVDPILASPAAMGDWAKVVIWLGGSWYVRLAVFAVGGTGTVAGYFLFGAAARRFVREDATGGPHRLGADVCLLPYLFAGGCLTALALAIGSPAAQFAIFLYWGGYLGLFWAFMITFVWSKDPHPLARQTTLPARVSVVPLAALLLLLWIVLALESPFVAGLPAVSP